MILGINDRQEIVSIDVIPPNLSSIEVDDEDFKNINPLRYKIRQGDNWMEITPIRLTHSFITDKNQVETVYQAPAPNGVDDTVALKEFFANGYKNVHLEGTYRVKLNRGDSIASFSNVNDIRIMGENATVIDLKTDYTNAGIVTPIFKFSNCRNVYINLNYQGQKLLDPKTELGYIGAAVFYFINGCENITVRGNLENCRYGVLSGDYTFPEYGNCKDFDIKINTLFVGYPIALYLAERVNAYIIADSFHRVAYLAGIIGGCIRGYAQNQYIADVFVLLTDAKLSDGSRGCRGINVFIKDTGSTTYEITSCLAGIGPSRADAVNFTDIFIKIELITTTTVTGFRLAGAWTSEMRVDNLTLSGTIDRTKRNDSIPFERDIAIRGNPSGQYLQMSNLSFENLIIKEQTNAEVLYILVQAEGLTEGLRFKDCTFTDIDIQIFTKIETIDIINSTLEGLVTNSKTNIV